MKLLLLGSGGYHPSSQRHTACLMLPEVGVVLDAGTGMFRLPEHLATDQLDIFITHAHLDHVIGLTYLLGLLHDRGMRRVTVHGTEGKLAAVREHLFAEPVFPIGPRFEMRPLAEKVALPGGGSLSWFRLDHPGGSIGYRLDWPGHSLAYVTDTTAAADAPYIEAIRGVNLLAHECYFGDDRAELARQSGHSCASAVAEVARAAGVDRLILTHIDPSAANPDPLGLDSMRKIFAATEVGRDGMELEF
jgi:ribonuclease BN (tRNA processing enzyme)